MSRTARAARRLVGAVFRVTTGFFGVVTSGTAVALTVRMLAGLRLLVVEDVAGVRRAIASLLRLEGASVVEAGSGREACHLLRNGEFDVALTDLGLPDMPGEAVIAYVRAHSGGRTPVAVLSAASDVDLARALALGAERVFPKPIDWEDLVGYLTRQVAVAA